MNFTIFELLLTALFIFGINAVTRKNQLLEIVSFITEFEGKNTFVLAKVVSECCTCMSSLYGILAYLYLTGKIPNYNPNIELIICLLILLSSIEIWFSRLPIGLEDKVLKMGLYGVQKFSLSAYAFLIGYFIFENGYFEGLVFVIALAGLNNLIALFSESAKASFKMSEALNIQTNAMINCATELIAKIK